MSTSHNASGLLVQLELKGLLPKEKAAKALSQAEQQKLPLVRYLVQESLITSKTLADFCESEYGIPLLDLDSFQLEDIPDKFVNDKLIEKHHAVPIYTQGNTLYIAMSDPTNVAALEDFGFSFAMHTEALLVDEDKLQKAIEKLTEEDESALGDLNDADIGDIDVDDSESRLDESQKIGEDDAPIVKYINKILSDAIKKGASDIHFEPYEKKYRVRLRIDGILTEVATPPVNLTNRFSARLKVMSKLDIAERRIPQDGRIKLKLSKNKSMDMRVSTLPTMWGEKIVMRILDSSAANLDIEKLGYSDKQKKQYLNAISKPQGMILITGPTGSGKTVSLYTGLNILNTPERNISTAEDPVEINLEGINQVQMNPKAGLTFAASLRSFLRQDPDIVMVGEIRDLETAEIGIKAAQTGHLVLSTLHTNSAAETLTRLLNMGVPAFNVASSVTLIMAQRLARRLCEHCKTSERISAQDLQLLGFTPAQIQKGITTYKAVGCEKCTDGYKGRVGIYEIMEMSDSIGRAILDGANSIQLNDIAQKEGMHTLRQSALIKAVEGVTSLSEVTRVTNL